MSVITQLPGNDSHGRSDMGASQIRSRDLQRSRDPFIDLVRAGALFVVVIWHWVFTSIRWAADGPHVGNPVASTPGMWTITWILQVMPAFFIVGGFLHSTTLSGPDRPSARTFWVNRTKRLLLPVAPLLLIAATLIAAFTVTGRNDLVRGVILVISPMWFLATYLVCIAVAPVAQRLHDRFGLGAVAGGLAAALVIDWLRIGAGIGGALTGALAFVTVWGTVHQLGFSLGALRRASRRAQITTAAVGYSLLGLAAALFAYPAAMVGLDGHKLSNMGPPTAMVVFLAIGQLGLLCLAAPALTRFAKANEALLTKAGEWSMTVYAWHLCAYALFWYVIVRMGVHIDSVIDARWWSQRPVWLLGPLAFAIPVCRFTRRFDRSSS